MSYRIDDEPLPGPLQRYATSPYFCLLSIMLAGVWLSWPWFVLNGKALGSPTWKREATWAGVGLFGNIVVVMLVFLLADGGVLPERAIKYAVILIPTWKLLVSYVLYDLQKRTFHLYEYYGGTTRNGMPLVMLGMIFGKPMLVALLTSAFWRAVLI